MPEDTRAYLKINRQVNIGNMRDHIIHHKHGEPYKEKAQQKFKWTTETMNKVDWNSHGKATRQKITNST